MILAFATSRSYSPVWSLSFPFSRLYAFYGHVHVGKQAGLGDFHGTGSSFNSKFDRKV